MQEIIGTIMCAMGTLWMSFGWLIVMFRLRREELEDSPNAQLLINVTFSVSFMITGALLILGAK